MTLKQGGSAKRHGLKRVPRSALALGLLLIAAGIALIAETPSEGFWGNSVAAADGDGGSTVPIPPPKRPTPQASTVTPSETPTSLDVLIDLILADVGLRVLPEAAPPVGQQVVFPLPTASELGMGWQEGPPILFTISLVPGQAYGDLKIKLDLVQADGREVTAKVLEVVMSVGPVEVKKTGSQLRTARFSAELGQLPTRVVIDLRGVPPDSVMVAALGEAASALDMGIASIAHAARIDTNLDELISSASVEMAVEQGWAETWPRDRVVIARIGQDGKGRVLETTRLAEDGSGLARFRAESGEGFSTFALVALGEPALGESGSGLRWVMGLGIGLGVVALVGLATGALLLVARVRRSKKP